MAETYDEIIAKLRRELDAALRDNEAVVRLVRHEAKAGEVVPLADLVQRALDRLRFEPDKHKKAADFWLEERNISERRALDAYAVLRRARAAFEALGKGATLTQCLEAELGAPPTCQGTCGACKAHANAAGLVRIIENLQCERDSAAEALEECRRVYRAILHPSERAAGQSEMGARHAADEWEKRYSAATGLGKIHFPAMQTPSR